MQAELGLERDVERWLEPLDANRPSSSLYQTANRIVYTVWLHEQGVDAWLCHLLYLDDLLFQPTSRPEWERGIADAERALGIDHLALPFAGHAFLPALDPNAELAGDRPSA